MYVRFVITAIDPDSTKRQGLFQALGDLHDSRSLLEFEDAVYLEIRDWFRCNLNRPDRLAKSNRPHAKNVALSWFKDTALEHIKKMREMANILEAHGYSVEMIKSERPGFIVYEDAYQVAAEPFRSTIT